MWLMPKLRESGAKHRRIQSQRARKPRGPNRGFPTLCYEPLEERTLLAADTMGTDFWLAFPESAQSELTSPGHKLSIFVTSDVESMVEVSGFGFYQFSTVAAGSATEFIIPLDAELSGSDVVENKGVHVTADHEVSVYGLNRSYYSSDAFLALPTDVLGTEYISLSYPNFDGNFFDLHTQFAIVATADGTEVTITPSETTSGHDAGQSYTIGLNQGQTYQLQNGETFKDLSGTTITSNRPVALFGGNDGAHVIALTGDHLVEAIPPVSSFGTEFVTLPLATRSFGDWIRILVSVDNTNVTVNGTEIGTRDRGQTLDIFGLGAAQPLHITASQPVLVAQFSTGHHLDENPIADPSMMLVPATDRFMEEYVVVTPDLVHGEYNTEVANFISIVAPADYIDEITVDGMTIPPVSFEGGYPRIPIGTSNYRGIQFPVDPGVHMLHGPGPFGAFVYGYLYNEAYSYPAGFSIPNRAPTVDAGSIYRIREGEAVTLDASASSDPDGDLLSYAWDLNGDDVFLDASGVMPTLTWAQLLAMGIDDGPGAFDVRVRVNDGQGHSVTSRPAQLVLSNTAPSAVFVNDGPLPEGGSLEVSFSAQFDPSIADTAARFRYSYDFDNDGAFEITDSAVASATVPAPLLDDGPGALLVRGRIADKDGGSTDYLISITITNVAPTATLSNSGPVEEGSSATVSFSDQFDPSAADTAAGFRYSYDFDNDGVFEVSQDLSASMTVPADLLDNGPGTRVMRGRIEDKDGGYTDYATTIVINNVVPAASIAGPPDGVRGQARTFTLAASDPSTADQAAGFIYMVSWGDGTPTQNVAASPANGGGIPLDHTFTNIGAYTVWLTAEDKDGGISDTVMHAITITVVSLQLDDCNTGMIQLAVGGTTDDDQILIAPAGNSGSINVSIDGLSYGTFTPTGRVLVFGQSGDDNIHLAGAVSSPAWLYGDDGNDRLKGGSGPSVLLGGNGDDLLVGSSNRDLLIGGTGADRIVGNAADDILIAGITAFDANDAALCAIMDEWTSARDYATRMANLSGTGTDNRLNGNIFLMAGPTSADATVFDDEDDDVLTGSAGIDWFFANLDTDGAQDRITDLNSSELADDLDFILSP